VYPLVEGFFLILVKKNYSGTYKEEHQGKLVYNFECNELKGGDT